MGRLSQFHVNGALEAGVEQEGTVTREAPLSCSRSNPPSTSLRPQLWHPFQEVP